MALTLGHIEIEVPNGDVTAVERVSPQTTFQQYIQYKIENPAGRKYADDPFCVADLGKLLDAHEKWLKAMPNVEPFYAVKCNDDIMVLKTLAALGTGFDCASLNEMKTVMELGVSSDRIIYASAVKQVSHLLWAKENKVDLMTFDNESELVKISKHFPGARLVIRMFADSPGAVCPLGSKFGCTYDVAEKLIQRARALKLNMVGVSFHVGSMCMNPASYQDAIELAHKVFQYAESEGYHMTLLDIGGGYHGAKDEQSRVLFEKTVEHVQKGLEKFKGIRDLKVIAEPGRFYPTSSYAVAANIIGKKFGTSDSGDPIVMYYLNDGIFGSMYFARFKYWFLPEPLKDMSSVKTKLKSTLWGPTCDSVDKINDCELPELEVGDWIYFDNMGAYTISSTTTFNGFEKIVTHFYINDSQTEAYSKLMQVSRNQSN